MNEAITIAINGEVVAKGRPRMTRRGFVYTPAATRKYEAHARLAAQLAMGDQGPLQVPVRIELAVELPVPTSWSNKRRLAALAGVIAPTSKPDIDNYVKTALDAINTIVVTDDALDAAASNSRAKAALLAKNSLDPLPIPSSRFA
jgi:Holliday junction resolvase RusA-like endonuclease